MTKMTFRKTECKEINMRKKKSVVQITKVLTTGALALTLAPGLMPVHMVAAETVTEAVKEVDSTNKENSKKTQKENSTTSTDNNVSEGVEEGVASFTASLGANMGMNGCAGIYPALMAVTIANMAGVEMNASFYAMLLVVITISSLGIAGLPGTATMAVSVVLSGVGIGSYFPLAGGILAIDPILDMGRTMLNVNGSTTTAVIVGKSLKKLDKEVFNGASVSENN